MTSQYSLTEEQEALRATLREFGDKVLAPRAMETEAKGEFFPRDVLGQMRDLGLLGIDIPPQYGGPGLDLLSCAIVMEEVSRGWFSASSYCAAMGTVPILVSGTEEQKQKYLPGIVRGEVTTAFALTEPDSGSDASQIQTTARREGDTYLLKGRKIFITNAHRADVMLTFARTDAQAERGKGVSIFLVDKGAPGLEIGQQFHTLGQSANPIWEVIFDDCRVPVGSLLGKENEGFSYIQVGFARTRAVYAARCVGLAQAALDYAAKYAQARTQFGQPISKFQAIRFKLADMATQIEAARHLVYRAAVLVEAQAPDAPAIASMAKLFASDTAMSVATEAVQILGGHGYTKEYPVERFFREAKLLQIGEGTNEIQRILISRHVLHAAA